MSLSEASPRPSRETHVAPAAANEPVACVARPAWVEVDLGQLAANIRRIRADLQAAVRLLYVVKDEAYGLGAVPAARVALANGVSQLAVYTIEEGAVLRAAGITAPILILGERVPDEVSGVLSTGLVPCVGTLEMARFFDAAGTARGRRVPIQVKINSGMNRYGFHWRQAAEWTAGLAALRGIEVVGMLSHFAQSDEEDKTFARQQLGRFRECLAIWTAAGLSTGCVHMCNSGGFLDLPEAHFDMVRVGLLAGGVYPSSVCRRIEGLGPVLSVRTRIVAEQQLEPGDTVGYGMRWSAERPARVGVLPIGYGDGFPRVRNQGAALIRGHRVPIVGGVAMDALTVDLTDLPEAVLGDEAVLMGRQGNEEITAQEVARLKQSVTYDVLVGWRRRLPRVFRNETGSAS
jgi:alanine racemase